MRSLALRLVAYATLVHSLRLAQPPRMMAGFGSGASKAKSGKAKKGGKPAVAQLSAKRQWDRFREHRDDGISPVAVFARVRDSEAWLPVGEVTAKDVPPAGAVQIQKRLILEHAVRVNPQLQSKARDLECGFDAAGATVKLERTEPAEAAASGFQGKPEASGRYGKTEAEQNEREPSSLRAATSSVGGALE